MKRLTSLSPNKAEELLNLSRRNYSQDSQIRHYVLSNMGISDIDVVVTADASLKMQNVSSVLQEVPRNGKTSTS